MPSDDDPFCRTILIDDLTIRRRRRQSIFYCILDTLRRKTLATEQQILNTNARESFFRRSRIAENETPFDRPVL